MFGLDPSRLLAVAVAVMATLAGCGAFTVGDRASTPAETVTPAPVPTVEPTATPRPERVAPGVSEARVLEPLVLAGAHVGQLRNRSYVLRYNRTVRAVDGSYASRRQIRGAFEARGGRYRAVVRADATDAGNGTRTVYHYDGRRVVRERRSGGEASTRLLMDGRGVGAAPADPVEVLPFDPDFGGRIYALLAAANGTSVTRLTRNRLEPTTVTYRVEATEFGPAGDEAFENATFRALVRGDGVVTTYRLRYTTVRNGTRVRVRERVAFTNFGFAPDDRVRDDT